MNWLDSDETPFRWFLKLCPGFEDVLCEPNTLLGPLGEGVKRGASTGAIEFS